MPAAQCGSVSRNLVPCAKRRAFLRGDATQLVLQTILTAFGAFWLSERRTTSVRIKKFARSRGRVPSKFLDQNHTSKSMFLVSLLTPKFAPDASIEITRTSESGHWRYALISGGYRHCCTIFGNALAPLFRRISYGGRR